MTKTQIAELYNLYHIARTALCTKPYAEQSPYYRKLYAACEFNKLYPDISRTRAYLAFERTDAGMAA